MELVAAMLLAGVLGAAAVALVSVGGSRGRRQEEPGRRGNPRSRWLGKEVLVLQRGTGVEERCVVICESWKGAVRVRPVDGAKAYWVSKQFVDERVREP